MNEQPSVTIMVVDDHELIAAAMVLALRADGFTAVRNGGRSAVAILAEAARTAAGVVLLDLELGWDDDGRRIDGVALIPALTRNGWQVIAVSGVEDRTRIGAALGAGALAHLPKRAPLQHLISAVRAAVEGKPIMDPERREAMIAYAAEQDRLQGGALAKLGRLSQREREVLEDLAQGLRAQAIADKRVVALATVRTQIRGILTKLDVGSQLEAVALYRNVRGT